MIDLNLTQNNAPVYEALKKHMRNRVVRLDVPGHKGGRMNKELRDFLGVDCLKCDVNSMKPLDNLCHPVSVIKDAEMLAAEAFGAKHAFFIVNGTTAAVQTMIFTSCKAGKSFILCSSFSLVISSSDSGTLMPFSRIASTYCVWPKDISFIV